MKNPKTVEKATSKLLDLIVQYNHDGEDEVINKIYNEVEKVFHQGKIQIEDMIEVMLEKTQEIEDIMLFKSVCEDVSSILYVHGKDETFEASLFLVPIMYVETVDQPLKTIAYNDPTHTKLAKTFKKSGLFSQETDVYLHNRVYSGKELLNTNYNEVFNMTEILAQYTIMNEDNIQILDANAFQEDPIEKNTLALKFMLGIKIINKNEPQLTEDEQDTAFAKFVKLSQPYIKKLIGLDDYNILLVDNFYKAFQTGLDIYMSTGRQLKINESLTENEISPRGLTAIIHLMDQENDQSRIELISKLTTDTLSNINFETFNHNTIEQALAMIASDLVSTGLKQEDLFVKWQKKIVPYVSLLENNQTEPVDINEFMISNTKKATLH